MSHVAAFLASHLGGHDALRDFFCRLLALESLRVRTVPFAAAGRCSTKIQPRGYAHDRSLGLLRLRRATRAAHSLGRYRGLRYLIPNSPTGLEKAGLPPAQVQQSLRAIDKQVPNK